MPCCSLTHPNPTSLRVSQWGEGRHGKASKQTQTKQKTNEKTNKETPTFLSHDREKASGEL